MSDGVDARKLNMDTWERRLTRSVADAIKHWRNERNMTAKDVESATERLGHKVPRSVVVNLENDRRESVTLAELLVIAAALDVAPVLLIASLGKVNSVEALPGVEITPWEVRGWLHGAFVPPYGTLSYDKWRQAQVVLALNDVHRALVKRYMNAEDRLRVIGRDLSDLIVTTPPEQAMVTFRRRHAAVVRDLVGTLDELRTHRRRMDEAGYLPPPLPPAVEEALSHGSTEPFGGDDEQEAIDELERERAYHLNRRTHIEDH